MPTLNQNQITSAFIQQFHDTFDLATQQMESRLLKTITNRGRIQGASFTINDLGTVEMEDYARFSDTTWQIPTAGVRTAIMSDKKLFIPIEHSDVPKLKASPQDKYAKLWLAARERKVDDVIYKAILGSISRKTVDDAGDEQTSIVSLPSSQIILAGGAGFTKQKLVKAKSIFRDNECDEENGEEITILYNSTMLEQILLDTTLTSADFMAVKMLQEGSLSKKWLGINWVPYNKLDNGAGGATERRTVMYTKTSTHYGDAPIAQFKINERPDKNNIMQMGGVQSMAAGRANEDKVVAIDFLI
ncbi:phage capsid protein [Acinetobacter baumannii]|uniref:phage capsid protein n=1 Tax=Acinetobacter calcoaceticus/baumannii complex TaxID=909768 RepID=UPI0003471B4D|nr:phage capsid protein [Acinetobacter baumannii]KQG35923.1 hypothetical protein APC38_00355 [Acinetobacter baumannii]MCZ0696038.1 phage capsid protein [Acinetobacter baumannii]OLV83574.1 hypothetical protein BS437_17390 [Acinetobacter baumannii]SSO90936.1 Uncharacterised protein [Acinetobacter baumannii]